MKLLEMGKDMKIKHSVYSPPCKVWGNLFLKKTLNEGTNVFEQICGGMFYMRTNDQIIQWGTLMVKRFQRSSQVSFRRTDPNLGY